MVGLRITVPYIWRKPVTIMYPHDRLQLPDRARNRLYVNQDDCIGCDQCSRACPVNCITIETAKAVGGDTPGITSNGKKKALWVTRFDIDIAKCCYCGLCVFPCPTECIKMTDVFEFAEQERNNLIYNYVNLTSEEIQEKVETARRAEEDIAARKASAAAETPAAPAAASAPAPASAPAATAPAAPAVPPSIAGDDDKARKLAELQAKMAAARAAKEGGASAPAPSPAPPAEAAAPATPEAPAASNEDAEKAARVAAMKAKIEEARAKKGGS
jgi:NADH-quinone oxidoreductase subunit I